MSIDDHFNLLPPMFFDDVEDGVEALRRILLTVHKAEIRSCLVEQIRQLEAGEVNAAMFMGTSSDGAVQIIIVGGDVHVRLDMIEKIKAELTTMATRQVH